MIITSDVITPTRVAAAQPLTSSYTSPVSIHLSPSYLSTLQFLSTLYSGHLIFCYRVQSYNQKLTMAVPFIPIFPLCFQCGTDQNPCRCKVVGPTLGMYSVLCTLYSPWIDNAACLRKERLTSLTGFCCTVVAAVCSYTLSFGLDLRVGSRELTSILLGRLLSCCPLLWMLLD